MNCRHSSLPLVLFALLIFGSSVTPAKAQEPVMTYIRFNRYGTQINVLYCAVANDQTVVYGEQSPNYWREYRLVGAINGCTSSVPYWYAVAGNERLFFINYLRVSNTNSYSFTIVPTGTSNLSCTFDGGPNMIRDTRLVSSTACAFITP